MVPQVMENVFPSDQGKLKMNKIKHKVVRVGEQYQIQRMFKPDGINPIWVEKRMGYPNTPGEIIQHRFLNQAIKDIRSEKNGKKSFIILNKAALAHLKSINFPQKSIKLLVGNEEKNKENENAFQAIS
jgi:hypothetical protein